jgi:uncharacterized YkwD family protein
MKRRIFAAALILILMLTAFVLNGGSVSRAEEKTFYKVNFISGVVIANELNLRTGPSTSNPVITVLKKGKWVNVLSQIEDWYVVYDPAIDKVGCVAKQYLVDGATYNKGGGTATPAPKPPAATPAPSPAPSVQLSAEEQQLLALINKERSKNGLPDLKPDLELMKVARVKAGDMVQNNYFSHYSPTYGSPFDMMRQFGVTFKAAAENIAGNSSIQGAVTAWMGSSGHRANILNRSYNYTGIGITKSNKYGYMFVQMFIQK